MSGAAGGPWGFIGVGEMGEPMVSSLLSGGLEVIAFDRDPHRVALSRSRGAATADDVAQLARAARVVSVCVRHAADLEDVLGAGLLEAASPDTTVLVHSTVGRGPCRAAAARLAERGAGLLDAPVSGMRMAAEARALTFFVGGREELLEHVRHGLDAMGRSVVHVGDVGAGQVVKIVNNLTAFATAGIVHEAVAVAGAAGVGEQELLDALARGSARSWVVENWRFLRREWIASQPGGADAVRAIVAKDLSLATGMAEEVAVEALFAGLAARIVPDILAAGAGD